MKISEGKINVNYNVIELQLDPAIRRRLESLGITEGSRIQILNRKRNGAFIIKTRGTRWAIGKQISEGIICREEKNEKGN